LVAGGTNFGVAIRGAGGGGAVVQAAAKDKAPTATIVRNLIISIPAFQNFFARSSA